MDKVMNLFGNVCQIDLSADEDGTRKYIAPAHNNAGELLPIYSDGDDVKCRAVINVKHGKKIEHNGVKVELIGQIETGGERVTSYDFFSIIKDLEPPGILIGINKYSWVFKAVDKQHETYSGIAVRLRYFVRLTVQRSFMRNIVKEADMIVQNPTQPSDLNTPLKLEVGIEEYLHIEFEYDKSMYHLNDVIIGKVFFMLVRLKVKTMEIELLRTETIGTGSQATSETKTLTKFEVMDGIPVRMESIPVRLYLSGIDLAPSYKNVQGKFSVKYYINLVLLDEEDRRYFKKQEITFWRDRIG